MENRHQQKCPRTLPQQIQVKPSNLVFVDRYLDVSTENSSKSQDDRRTTPPPPAPAPIPLAQ